MMSILRIFSFNRRFWGTVSGFHLYGLLYMAWLFILFSSFQAATEPSLWLQISRTVDYTHPPVLLVIVSFLVSLSFITTAIRNRAAIVKLELLAQLLIVVATNCLVPHVLHKLSFFEFARISLVLLGNLAQLSFRQKYYAVSGTPPVKISRVLVTFFCAGILVWIMSVNLRSEYSEGYLTKVVGTNNWCGLTHKAISAELVLRNVQDVKTHKLDENSPASYLTANGIRAVFDLKFCENNALFGKIVRVLGKRVSSEQATGFQFGNYDVFLVDQAEVRPDDPGTYGKRPAQKPNQTKLLGSCWKKDVSCTDHFRFNGFSATSQSRYGDDTVDDAPSENCTKESPNSWSDESCRKRLGKAIPPFGCYKSGMQVYELVSKPYLNASVRDSCDLFMGDSFDTETAWE